MSEERAAIVQGDRSILLEVAHPGYERARDALAPFAELVRSPEHVHTYRISDLSLWNAASLGAEVEDVLEALRSVSRFAVPEHIEVEIRDVFGRHGVASLHPVPEEPGRLRLRVRDPALTARLLANAKLRDWLAPCPGGAFLDAAHRAEIKLVMLKMGYPVIDEAGLADGAPFALAPRLDQFTAYPFQAAAVRAFESTGGHGVIVLPCGSGKTIVGLMAAAQVGTRTLVVTQSQSACEQWRREALARFTVAPDEVGIYGPSSKDVRPLTLTTYAMLARRGGDGPTGHVHFDRLVAAGFGLIVYDEVHLVPAPVFRLTAALQARRRLGLTATLVREDGREGDVFALIGPKRYDVPWRELESSGHVAEARCVELRVPLCQSHEPLYAAASPREEAAIAAANPRKLDALRALLERHSDDRILILGSYVEPLVRAAEHARCPLITGATPNHRREELYEAFRAGELSRLALSRVGNASLDLPSANVLIQLSGSMGSRQEEAQRLGRILRPKAGAAHFYTVVTRGTVEQRHALHRQMFLAEQGYRYAIEDLDG